tara:strand:- start:7470 stop:8501 length:1032 start_codon:yes stop_codon:yes gene_type:complete
MKIFLLFACLLSITNSFAADGIVIVLEAPLLASPSLDAQVKQTLRRGDKVYLHDQHFNESAWESTSDASQRVAIIDDIYNEEFYQTLSKDGLPAFIQAKYVKVIFKDNREASDPVARFKTDPTDYRLEEPLPDGFPLSEREKKKASALFTMATHTKSSYEFDRQLIDESFDTAYGLDLIYMTKVSYDLFDRFYFGTKFGFENNDVELGFLGGDTVKQSLGRYSAAPYISFDIYKTEKSRISAHASIAVSYHRAYLTYKASNEQVEERAFSAWGFTPELGASWQWVDIIPKVDLVLGASLIAQPSVELTPATSPVANFWNDEDDVLRIKSGLRANFALGIQSRY